MPAGRPSKFKPEFCEQAEKLCKLGATDVQLADFFGVDERTINRWKQEHDEFCQSLKAGKEIADAMVAESLYHRAVGYTHPEEKSFCSNGEVITHETLKHYPPDATSAIFWLKNRRPDVWRDKRELGLDENTVDALKAINTEMSPEEAARIYRDTIKSDAKELH